MSDPPHKRRKMRPDNRITKDREQKTTVKNNVPTSNDNMPTTTSGLTPTDKPVRNTIKRKKRAARNIPVAKQYSSASDSDDTDKETKPLTRNKKPIKKPKKASATTKIKEEDISASDENSETDEEVTNTVAATASTSAAMQPASGSDDASKSHVSSESEPDNTRPQLKSYRRNRTSEYIYDSDCPDDDIPSSPIKFNDRIRSKDHLAMDRISSRKTNAYDPTKSTSFNLRNRFNDLFIPNVSGSAFVSDSDSDSSDSGDDYENKEYPPWHRTLGTNQHPDKEPWPKPRKLGYSDKLKLEKRIKKICRRENMTFEEAREIFSRRKEGQLRFFQKIGKIFPDMPLFRLTKLCKETYHIKRNNSPWTPEEIKQLEELVTVYGRNAEKISNHMNRSPKNIHDFFYTRYQTTAKASQKWTKEEDEILAKAIAEQRRKDPNKKISFLSIEPLFKGQRSQMQIYGRASLISHRIQPDGTLLEQRKATPQEELEYLQSLMKQVTDHNLTEESQLNLKKNRGFVSQSFYLRRRNKIKDFETMHVKGILEELIEEQRQKVAQDGSNE